MLDAIAHAQDVRQRLRRPPNAVPDAGINLRAEKPRPVKGRDSRLYFWPSWRTDTQLLQRLKGEKPKVVPFSEIKLAGIAQGHFPLTDEIVPVVSEGDACERTERPPTFDEIKLAVCAYFQLKPSDITSARRTMNICRPRQIAMWFCRRVTGKSFPSIGRYYGGRDHSTAISAIERIDKCILSGAPERAHVIAIAELMRNRGLLVPTDIDNAARNPAI